MPLKLTCPHCGNPTRLSEPLPLPGVEVQCETCGLALAVTYPDGVMEQLKAKGKQFQVTPTPPAQRTSAPRRPSLPPPPKAPPPPPPSKAVPQTAIEPTAVPTSVDRTQIDPNGPAANRGPELRTHDDRTEESPSFAEFGDRTVPSSRTPYGALPGNADEPESVRPLSQALDDMDDDSSDEATDDHAPSIETLNPSEANKGADKLKKPGKASKSLNAKAAPRMTTSKRRSLVGCLAKLGIVGFVPMAIVAGLLLLTGIGVAGGGYWYFSKDLPSVEALQAYEPPTGTVVYDSKGNILGEIFEERRYVVTLDKIPDPVQNAFVSAEDANFWHHGGVDWPGLARAMVKAAIEGHSPTGTSTITQQVTRNFLLTNEKSVVRKIKEILLAWRIEDTYDKKHILFLYLNEIYLGSGAYGVEAASRVYFDKHVQDLDLAEAAMPPSRARSTSSTRWSGTSTSPRPRPTPPTPRRSRSSSGPTTSCRKRRTSPSTCAATSSTSTARTRC
jgi:hypothetical protein